MEKKTIDEIMVVCDRTSLLTIYLFQEEEKNTFFKFIFFSGTNVSYKMCLQKSIS